ncbi:MAG TPA: BTAD domain-containing putative transcriptional regulator [Euzebyales bacterium]|nr:BTAD domain-containing putative transcriptional regulator [Euzebyales bacterium]
MHVRVLGTLEVVTDDGGPVPLPSPKLRRLLAALVIDAGSVVSADRLADVVWGDDPPKNATGALHNLVSRLRGRLRADDARPVTVETRAPGYTVTLARDMLDATRFADLVDRARAASGDPAAAADLYDEALGLWRGDAYAEFRDEEFARAEAARLGELRVTATEERIEAALALGRTDDAVARLEVLNDAQPLRERPQALLMVALYRAGRQADALAAYRDYRDLLDRELGLEPSAALRSLEQQILRGDPQLGGPSVAADLPVATGRNEDEDATSQGPTPPVQPVGLPPAPDLVGRDDLVARVCAALGAGGPVTLIGPGGVGKTSVAVRSTMLVGPGHRDGPWWCELASIDADDAVAEVVMTALDAQPRAGMTTVEGIVEVLRPRRGLLVLDNAEHVIDGVVALVGALVRSCPGIAMLVTSRERLGVTTERVVEVPPLAVPPAGGDSATPVMSPAVELFARRAAAGGHFALTPDNLAVVTDICRRLDGVPLALELAATRMRSMTPADLASRLSWRFRVLRGGRRGGAARHRTLRAVVDWSYGLLDERARVVFDRLSVFAGTFTLDAAEHVVALGTDADVEARDVGGPGAAVPDVDVHDVAEVVADLVDASMVVAHTDADVARYGLLDTLRAYGRERLEARAETRAARHAHAAYHVDLAEHVTARLFDADDPVSAVIIDREIDELRAAHAWSVEHDLELALRLVSALPVYVEQRALGEAFAWAERVIDVAEQVGIDSPWLPGAYGAAAMSARFRGDLPRALKLAERGLAHADGPDDPAGYVARYTLSDVALYEGRLDDVLRLADDLGRMPAYGPQHLFGVWVRANRALAHAYRGETDAAVAEAERLLEAGQRANAPTTIAWAAYGLAETLVETDPQRALSLAEDALARSRALDDRFLTGVALVTTASLLARHGDAARAVPLFRETVDRWHRAGNWTQQWVTTRSIVGMLLRLRADEDAAVLLGVLSTRTTAAEPYGADARRLAEAAEELGGRLGAERLAAARARGAAMDDDAAIVWLLDVLAALDDDG